jgi:Domain of unknown function (DUF6379)
MTLEASVLGKEPVRSVSGGYEVDVHLPWYRSLPLSCVENVEATIAGLKPARDAIRVKHDGRLLTLEELGGLTDEQWFVQDPLTLFIPAAAPLAAGAEADVEVALAARIPYIIIGPETALVQRARVARRIRIA